MEDHAVHVGDRVPRQAGQSHKVANELKYQTGYNIRKKYNTRQARISNELKYQTRYNDTRRREAEG